MAMFRTYISTLRAQTRAGFPGFRLESRQGSLHVPRRPCRFPASGRRSYATYHRFDEPPLAVKTARLLGHRTTRILIILGAIPLVYYATKFEPAPVTGRRRFMAVSPEFERRMGEFMYNQQLAAFQGKLLPASHPQTIRVARVVRRLLETIKNDLDPHQSVNMMFDDQTRKAGEELLKNNWRIHVVYDPEAPPNAFVMPSGKVFVMSSILPLCSTDDELATVLAHEVSHQLARHTGEQLSKSPLYIMMSMVLFTITGSSGLNQLLISSLFERPASREMETEADHIGLMLMSSACYDPSAALSFWSKMAQTEKAMGASSSNLLMAILSTHPLTDKRMENMRSWMQEAYQKREMAGCESYNSFMSLF